MVPRGSCPGTNCPCPFTLLVLKSTWGVPVSSFGVQGRAGSSPEEWLSTPQAASQTREPSLSLPTELRGNLNLSPGTNWLFILGLPGLTVKPLPSTSTGYFPVLAQCGSTNRSIGPQGPALPCGCSKSPPSSQAVCAALLLFRCPGRSRSSQRAGGTAGAPCPSLPPTNPGICTSLL